MSDTIGRRALEVPALGRFVLGAAIVWLLGPFTLGTLEELAGVQMYHPTALGVAALVGGLAAWRLGLTGAAARRTVAMLLAVAWIPMAGRTAVQEATGDFVTGMVVALLLVPVATWLGWTAGTRRVLLGLIAAGAVLPAWWALGNLAARYDHEEARRHNVTYERLGIALHLRHHALERADRYRADVERLETALALGRTQVPGFSCREVTCETLRDPGEAQLLLPVPEPAGWLYDHLLWRTRNLLADVKVRQAELRAFDVAHADIDCLRRRRSHLITCARRLPGQDTAVMAPSPAP
jgi:hypothetical protein